MQWRLRKIWMTLILATAALSFTIGAAPLTPAALAAGTAFSGYPGQSGTIGHFGGEGVNYGKPKVF